MHPRKVLYRSITPRKIQYVPTYVRPTPESQLWGFLCGAMAIAPNAELALDDADAPQQINPSAGSFTVHIPKPDVTTHKQLSWESLSVEARYVARLVLETPTEAVEWVCSPVQGIITRNRIAQYLRGRLRWKPEQVHTVFDELQQYVNGLPT